MTAATPGDANVWRLLALRGNRDSAFALLTRAKSIHNNDMTQLEVDSAYASLRHDARYAPLLPTTHDVVNLFVEDVKVIREIDGDSTGDQFGWIGRSIAGAASRAQHRGRTVFRAHVHLPGRGRPRRRRGARRGVMAAGYSPRTG